MNKLTYACGDGLDEITAYTCGTDFGNRIDVLFIGKDGVDFGFSGLTAGTDASIAPTVAELQAKMGSAYTATDKIIAIRHISNGVREKTRSTEISGMDTETGGSEEFDVYMAIKGAIKTLNNEVIEITQEYAQETSLKVWAVTNKAYIFGGLDGYKCASKGKFTPPLIDGTRMRIDFDLQYNTDQVSDKAVHDADYLTIDN